MDFNKRKLLVNAFFSLQFHYCPLIWMCHNTYNNKINRLHERCLRLIYSNKCSSFEELLVKDKSVSIHQKNIPALATEMFNPKTAGGGGGGVNLPPPPLCFSKSVSSKEREKPWFFVTFNIILRHIFPENFIEFPQVVQKI